MLELLMVGACLRIKLNLDMPDLLFLQPIRLSCLLWKPVKSEKNSSLAISAIDVMSDG